VALIHHIADIPIFRPLKLQIQISIPM